MYYSPRRAVHAEATPPTLFGGFALLREVLLRERISLVHAHQAFSAIAHEAILHARTMGYRVGRRREPPERQHHREQLLPRWRRCSARRHTLAGLSGHDTPLRRHFPRRRQPLAQGRAGRHVS